MLSAGRIVQFIAEISVTPVQQDVEQAGGNRETTRDGFIAFEPPSKRDAARARNTLRARIFADQNFPPDKGDQGHASG